MTFILSHACVLPSLAGFVRVSYSQQLQLTVHFSRLKLKTMFFFCLPVLDELLKSIHVLKVGMFESRDTPELGFTGRLNPLALTNLLSENSMLDLSFPVSMRSTFLLLGLFLFCMSFFNPDIITS